MLFLIHGDLVPGLRQDLDDRCGEVKAKLARGVNQAGQGRTGAARARKLWNTPAKPEGPSLYRHLSHPNTPRKRVGPGLITGQSNQGPLNATGSGTAVAAGVASPTK